MELKFQCKACGEWLPSGNSLHTFEDCQRYSNSLAVQTREATLREVLQIIDDYHDLFEEDFAKKYFIPEFGPWDLKATVRLILTKRGELPEQPGTKEVEIIEECK